MRRKTHSDMLMKDTFSFTMTWDEVCSKFDTLNLNWNPSLLPVTAVKHW